MHELLLHGTIPAAQHGLVLQVLAGLAATQPTPILEQHLIFRPTTAAGPHPGKPTPNPVPTSGTPGAGPAPTTDLFHLQLVGHMHARPLAGAGTPAHPPPAGPDSTRHPWTLEFRDLPDVAGKRGGATARLMSSTAIAAGDPVAFMAALGYGPAGGYVLDGDQLVHGNVAVQVFRLRPMPAGGFGRADVGRAEVAGWEMLDASGAWVVQASVRVGDGARVEWMVRGAEELAALRAALRGVVELEAADRLALDTRVR